MASGGVKKEGSAKLALVAMTLAGSVILVDQTAVPLATPDIVHDLHAPSDLGQWVLTANLLPLAAFMVLGGRLGDMFGLRKIFLIGTALFFTSTVVAITAPDIEVLILARVIQGVGAALMMPNTVSIVSTMFPAERRGSALGVLAGGTAFFAALGPLIGGVLAGIDWRLIFVVNCVLTLLTLGLTLRSVPRIPGRRAGRIDYPGVVTFALGIALFVFGIGQFANPDATALMLYGSIVLGIVVLATFALIELRTNEPLVKLRLLRDRNFAAANISQMIAGAIELGLGFLLPFQLLLIIGVSPSAAGLALLPASLPIIFAGPLAGRAFDKFHGRGPMTTGYLVLAASGVALAMGTSNATVTALIPGLILQGIGLGIVLTVNDPVGLAAVPDEDSGQAAGLINTSEQLGGALGIAGFLAIEYGHYISKVNDYAASQGQTPNSPTYARVRDYIMAVEQKGQAHVPRSGIVDQVAGFLKVAHISAYELMFTASAGVALVGAAISWALIRPGPPLGIEMRSRRMRWVISGLRIGQGIDQRAEAADQASDSPGTTSPLS
jgi:EmrB/QacA subfamily drug resistance transporter